MSDAALSPIEWREHTDREALVAAVTGDVARIISDALATRGSALLALAGGSTPWAIYSRLAALPLEWPGVTIIPGDERRVAPDHALSNLASLRRAFGDTGARILPLDEIDTSSGWPPDLVWLGMGGDGHTASIFPHQMELLSAEALCGVATHPESGQRRITLTGKVLNNASEVAFLVTGAEKSQKVEEIVKGKEGSERYPAAHIEPKGGELHWFLDEAAAGGLR